MLISFAGPWILHIQIVFLIFTLQTLVSAASLPSSHVRSACILPENLPAVVNVDINWLFTPRDPMYVPLGSQHLFRSYAEYFRGHAAADQEDLDKMNLRVSLGPFVINNTGYGEYFEQSCYPAVSATKSVKAETQFTFTCVPSETFSPNTKTTLISTTDDTLVWTDNSNTLMITSCVLGKYGDWKVLSVKPEITPDTRKSILAMAIKLGLDTRGLDISEIGKSEL